MPRSAATSDRIVSSSPLSQAVRGSKPAARQAAYGLANFRAGARGKTLSPEAIDFLCARTEGNLLAAAQEIDLLQLLVDEALISLEHALAAVSDSARYDVYKVVDSALTGDVARAVRMKFAPRLRFTVDETFDRSQHVTDLLKDPRVQRDLGGDLRPRGAVDRPW